MIRKETSHHGNRPVTRVTFELPAGLWADSVQLVGDFNHWRPGAHPLRQDRDGTWRLTLTLDQPGAYRCRYLVDGDQWLTDPDAR